MSFIVRISLHFRCPLHEAYLDSQETILIGCGTLIAKINLLKIFLCI